ncbi:MAG: 1,4-dihydroxy-6-naphthoate synthase [Desulfomonilaceae bacterium]
MTELSFAFSPCPNDTFSFHALLNRLVDTRGYEFIPRIYDVEKLNQDALFQTYQISKLSFYAYLLLKEKYELLDSGSALGFGCGPLLVASREKPFTAQSKVAVPGKYTTAFLLLKLWNPEIKDFVITRFDKILPGVKSGEFDAGLIIHEGRFVYKDYDCSKIVDLGEWWEKQTNSPIPLGCIAISKEANTIIHKEPVENIIRDSVAFAMKNRNDSRGFILEHAQELSETVIDSHINLYVNDFTLSLGQVGLKAIQKLDEMAGCKKVL